MQIMFRHHNTKYIQIFNRSDDLMLQKNGMAEPKFSIQNLNNSIRRRISKQKQNWFNFITPSIWFIYQANKLSRKNSNKYLSNIFMDSFSFVEWKLQKKTLKKIVSIWLIKKCVFRSWKGIFLWDQNVPKSNVEFHNLNGGFKSLYSIE